MKTKIAVAGAGFSGAVLARELASSGRFHVTVFERNSHVAGNCHTSRDTSTGIMLHHFGPHIFNTSREDVWQYMQQWSNMIPFTNRVKAHTSRGVFSLPINLQTINQFFRKSFGPAEARNFINSLGDDSIGDPKSFEEQALKFLGHELYACFFRDYTKKQWGVDPSDLPASILKRLPVRFNYDDNYYNQRYQGIPEEGYTAIVEQILDHDAIDVHLNTPINETVADAFAHLFWSGPMDAYFDYALGPLGYRTLIFERFDETGDFQGNAVINYCELEIPYTRISEHKHFTPWESHEQTVCFREYSKFCEVGETPYYPLRLNGDKALLERYVELAEKELNTTFIGRLGTYRYLDMHTVIGESIDLAQACLKSPLVEWPRFSKNPL